MRKEVKIRGDVLAAVLMMEKKDAQIEEAPRGYGRSSIACIHYGYYMSHGEVKWIWDNRLDKRSEGDVWVVRTPVIFDYLVRSRGAQKSEKGKYYRIIRRMSGEEEGLLIRERNFYRLSDEGRRRAEKEAALWVLAGVPVA